MSARTELHAALLAGVWTRGYGATPQQEAEKLALRHCAHLGELERKVFLLAFDAGRKAARADEDTERTIHRMVTAGDAIAAAGYLEGLAAVRRVARQGVAS